MVAGGPGGIVYSTDGGDTWHESPMERVGTAVTCMTASPSCLRDGVVLAGTDDAGILRSTDGGRSWRAASFGLQSFTVLALATAPEWGKREVAFAATVGGLYRSPNGGRAWKEADPGIGDEVVQAIAVSPDFARDGIVLVGTEAGGVFRSVDGGRTWHRWGRGLEGQGEFPAINALWLSAAFARTGVCLAATADGAIFRSPDAGASWSRVVADQAPILCLFSTGARIYAGLDGQGLLSSDDGGRSWHEEPHLVARGLSHLTVGAGTNLFAFGALEGVWRTPRVAGQWARIEALQEALPIFALGSSPAPQRPCLLAGTGAGLLLSQDDGRTWRHALPGERVLAIAFSPRFGDDGRVCVGTREGTLAISADAGATWDLLPSPEPGSPIVALVAPATWGESSVPVPVTFDAEGRKLTLWLGDDSSPAWEPWLQSRADVGAAHLELTERDQGPTIACLGQSCWQRVGDGWQRTVETSKPILRLLRLPGGAGFIAMTSAQLLLSMDGSRWLPWCHAPPGTALVDVALVSQARAELGVGALTTGGIIWGRGVPIGEKETGVFPT
jgi:photosystem II stability/assembly factor-like uncharacterized protein